MDITRNAKTRHKTFYLSPATIRENNISFVTEDNSKFPIGLASGHNSVVLIELKTLNDYPDYLGEYTHLKDVQLRSSFESEQGLYLAESNQVISRAIQAGHKPRSFLLAPHWLEHLERILIDCDYGGHRADGGEIPVFVGEEQLLQEIVGFHLHRGAIASMERPKLPSPELLMKSSRRLLVLEDLVDHTNVGAAVRSAAGCGYDAVLVTPSCADPLYRRAIRVSMGTIFQIPWTRLKKWPDPELFEKHDFELTALALNDDATELAQYRKELELNPHTKIALVAGAEKDGLKKRTLDGVKRIVKIEMANGVDSLNVAAACAVACWATQNLA